MRPQRERREWSATERKDARVTPRALRVHRGATQIEGILAARLPTPQRFTAGAQVRHRFGVDDHLMRNKSVLETVVLGAVAVAASILTGAGAGALLAGKPLLVPVQQSHQPYGRTVR